jgi:hypothetical protein
MSRDTDLREVADFYDIDGKNVNDKNLREVVRSNDQP